MDVDSAPSSGTAVSGIRMNHSNCYAWMAVMATVLKMPVTVQPRLSSLTGLFKPRSTGLMATAPALPYRCYCQCSDPQRRVRSHGRAPRYLASWNAQHLHPPPHRTELALPIHPRHQYKPSMCKNSLHLITHPAPSARRCHCVCVIQS